MSRTGGRVRTKAQVEERKRWWQKITRDLVLFALGVLIIINEVWLQAGPERTQILILATGLVGSPFIIRAEEARRDKAR